MHAHRFLPGEQFLWQGAVFEVKRLLQTERQIHLENLQTGACQTIAESVLVEAFFTGEVLFRDQLDQPHKVIHSIDLSSYPAEAVETARWRLQVIEPLLGLSRKKVPSELVKQRVEEVRNTVPGTGTTLHCAVSRSSIYRWIKAYRQSGNDLRALLPNLETRGGSGKSRLRQETNAVIDAVLKAQCYRPEKVALDDLLALIAARLAEENRVRAKEDPLLLPSRATVARRVASLDRQERIAAQQGKRTATRQFTQVEKMDYPELPYERVEIDHTRCDLLVIDKRDGLPLGRPTLTYCLDLATRYPLGYYLGFEPPSYYSVMECLYHAISPKGDVQERYGVEHHWDAYGIPGLLVVDNGKEFIGQDLNDACEVLGIVLQQCPVMTPELKAGIERHFRSLNTGVFHTIPGTTFSQLLDRGEYDSVKQACISLEELEKALTIFLIDIYAERIHRGLRGVPARCWEKGTATHFVPRLPPSKDELLVLLGRMAWRTIQPSGIQFECLRYNAPCLSKVRDRLGGEKVKFKYHPGDLSQIHVFDPQEKCYYAVPALEQEYAQGLSLWKHRLIRQLAAQEVGSVDLAALGRAREKIQQMVDQARTRKRTGTRSRVARWDGKASPTEPKTREKKTKAAPLPPAPDPAILPDGDAGVYEFDYHLPSKSRDE